MQLDMLAVLRVIYSQEQVLTEYPVIKELDVCVDAFIPHLNLAVETDGSFHRPKFLDNITDLGATSATGESAEGQNWQTTRTLFRTGLITETGCKLLRVTDLEWNRLKGLSAKTQFLTSRLQAVLVAPSPQPSFKNNT